MANCSVTDFAFFEDKRNFWWKASLKSETCTKRNFKSTIRLCIFSAFDQSLTPWFFFHTGNGFLWFFKQKTGDFFSEKSFSASKGINGCDKWLRFHAQKKLIPKKKSICHTLLLFGREKNADFLFYFIIHHLWINLDRKYTLSWGNILIF